MQFMLTRKACPHCGGTERYPAAAARNWRPMIFMRSYSCRSCHSQYIVLFGLFSRLVERGFKRSHDISA
jgi:transposase-like protein